MANTVVDPSNPVDYSSLATPPSYICGGCGKSGVKLWRDYQTFLENQSLRCVDCSATEQSKDITDIDERTAQRNTDSGPTDTIGWRIPAVPTAENNTFWGYTSVPNDGCEWWNNLPLR